MAKPKITVGKIAATDPIMSAASVIASGILLRIARATPSRKRTVFAREMNKVFPGLADTGAAEYDKLVKEGGRTDEQALFDAIRLTVANRLADRAEQDFLMAKASQEGVDALAGVGLGLSMSEVQQGFCIFGAGGSSLVGGYAETFTRGAMPGGALVGASQAAGNIAGCNTAQLQAQAATAQAQAQAAAQIAASQAAGTAARTQQILIVGGIGAVVLIGAVLLLK
jgi:hypothetical protein